MKYRLKYLGVLFICLTLYQITTVLWFLTARADFIPAELSFKMIFLEILRIAFLLVHVFFGKSLPDV